MKLAVVAITAFTLLFATTTAAKVYRPQRIAFDDLVDDQAFGATASSFMEALTNVGMLSVTDIPGLEVAKQDTMGWIHACAVDSKATQEQRFPDGTLRRTMATHTVGGAREIDHKIDNSMACDSFSMASDEFRQIVADVTQVFAMRLGSLFGEQDWKPLLSTKDGDSFWNIADVVEHGEHLEHFHSYQRKIDHEKETIDLHIDQGLFLVFTPGLIVNLQDSSIQSLSDGFYIEQPDGSRTMVEFEDMDDLIFLLGDGVNQYINNRAADDGALLRATPHALIMPQHEENEARVWYGRMVLPPANAIHPEHGETFGDLRQSMISSDESLVLGCSSTMRATRHLQHSDMTCEGDTFFCWHRCFNHTEEASPEVCQDQGLDLACINVDGELWDGTHDPQYFPGCVNSDTAEP